MLQGSYPARLKKVLIVTAPMWFRAPFKILRLFVKEKLRDRVGWIKVTLSLCSALWEHFALNTVALIIVITVEKASGFLFFKTCFICMCL